MSEPTKALWIPAVRNIDGHFQLVLVNPKTQEEPRVGESIETAWLAHRVCQWLADCGLTDIAGVLADSRPEADTGEGLTADEIGEFRDFVAIIRDCEPKGERMLFGSADDAFALRELIAERLVAKARAAEVAAKLAQPETLRTSAEVFTAARADIDAGHNVVVPNRYPGLSCPVTRSIGVRLRQYATTLNKGGLVHDANHRKSVPVPEFVEVRPADWTIIPNSAPADPAPGQAEAFAKKMANKHLPVSPPHISCCCDTSTPDRDPSTAPVPPIVADAATGSEDDSDEPEPWTPGDVVDLFVRWQPPEGYRLQVIVYLLHVDYDPVDRDLVGISLTKAGGGIATIHTLCVCDKCLATHDYPAAAAKVKAAFVTAFADR